MMDDNWKIVPTENLPPLPDLNVRLICRDCQRNPPNIVEEFADGDLVCGDCGLVLGDRIIDTRSEWRTFANEDEDPSRVGGAANPFLDGTQLDTIISKKDGGSGLAKGLARAHGRASANKGERTLVQAYREISSMCEHASLPKTIADTTKQLFKNARELNFMVGKENVLIAACLMHACRHEGYGRTFREISAITKVSKKDIGRAYKLLQHTIQFSALATSSTDMIVRFCSRLRLNTEVEKNARSVCEKARDLGVLDGKSPVSVAAACIYMVSMLFDSPRAAREIAVVAGVSEVTIKNAYKLLWTTKEHLLKVVDGRGKHLDALLPP